MRKADPSRTFAAINDDQYVAFNANRKLARLGQNEFTAIRLGQADALAVDNEEALDTRRITVFVMNTHKRSAELERVHQYLSLRGGGVKLKEFLGEGTDGVVWSTDRETAIKVFAYERGYLNERDTYERLARFGVTEQLDGFYVAKMNGCDDDLMVIEMDLMQRPPYIIDFAKVRLNSSPDFSKETIADNEIQGRMLFEDNWPAVKSLMAALESMLIFYLDPKPHNIVFPRIA
jgi:hypothetical protein